MGNILEHLFYLPRESVVSTARTNLLQAGSWNFSAISAGITVNFAEWRNTSCTIRPNFSRVGSKICLEGSYADPKSAATITGIEI